MRTKISVFCEHLIEGGWLLAAIVAPLFFNIYSHRVFEPDKLGIVRTIATLMALAWAIKWIEEHVAAPEDRTRENDQADSSIFHLPLILPTALLVAAQLLAAIFSVAPRISIWGSYQRLQGIYTLLSYVTIFLLALRYLRHREQLRRLVTVMIVTSLPIALYGLIQHRGLDPLPWGGDVTRRVASNMGNSIFVGAYLVMVIPLTLARVLRLQSASLPESRPRLRLGLGALGWLVFGFLLWAWIGTSVSTGFLISLMALALFGLIGGLMGESAARFWLIAGYLIILSVQITCLVFSGSRGPLIAVLASLFFLALVYVCARRKKWAIIALTALSVISLALLIVINLPGTPLRGVRKIPYVGRLARLLETDSGTGKVRLLIWQGALQMVKASPKTALIGYGPEAMYVAFNPYYPPDLAHYEARNASPDRSHNETFDALVTTGAIGLAAHLALMLLLYHYGLKRLGLIGTTRERVIFWALAPLGGVLGIVLPWAFEGTLRLAGVGIPMGIFVGSAAAAVANALLSPSAESGETPDLAGWDLLLFAALLATVVGHYVETSVGIAIAATRTLFWLDCALLLIVGQGLTGAAHEWSRPAATKAAGAQSRSRSKGARSRGRQSGRLRDSQKGDQVEVIALALLMAVIVSTLAWNYTTNTLGDDNPIEIIMTSLTTSSASRQAGTQNLSILGLWLGTAFMATLVSIGEAALARGEDPDLGWWLTALGWFVLIVGLISGIYALIHANKLTPGGSTQDLIYDYYGLLALIAVGFALYATSRDESLRRFTHGWMALLYPLALVAFLIFASGRNVTIIKADVLYKQGLKYDQNGMWDAAIQRYAEAIELAPNEDYYQLFAGRAILEKAKEAEDPAQSEALFKQALATLQEARRINPLNTDHTANLARLYRAWAEEMQDADKRAEKLQQSLSYYEQAHALSPHNAQLLNEWGVIYYMLGEYDQALAKYEQSLALDSEYAQTYLLLGDVYFDQERWPETIESYRQALRLDQEIAYAWSRLSYAHSRQENWTAAITTNLKVLEFVPEDFVTIRNLAFLYGQTDQTDEAIRYARKALAVASEDQKPALESYIEQLQATNQD